MTAKPKTRLSLDIDPMLHRSLKIAAAEDATTLQDLALKALKAWLRHRENEEDAAAIAEVKDSERLPWEQVKAMLGINDEEEEEEAAERGA